MALGLGLGLGKRKISSVLPVIPEGFVFLVDQEGNYLKDKEGNYLIVAE